MYLHSASVTLPIKRAGWLSHNIRYPRRASRCAQFHSFRQGMTFQTTHRLDPQAYTSGRWLCNDHSQRQSRYIAFDFTLLCEKIIALCPGAVSITGYDKIEGGFNRVFVFTTDNAKRLVAKLPFSLAGPPRLTTCSEVATVQYLRQKTAVPIPRIVEWNDDASNAIGSEYIIMEEAPGLQLTKIWPNMDGSQQIRCIRSIYERLNEVANMKFSAYGSLYFDTSLSASTPQYCVGQGFSIGPHCGATYWNTNAAHSRHHKHVKAHQGPWPDLVSYGDGLVDTGISKIPTTNFSTFKRPRYHGTIEEHINLLRSGRPVVRQICQSLQSTYAGVPTLFHPDLHKRNIFVSAQDPTEITAIIDWQSTAIEPAFWYADETPDFAKSDLKSPLGTPSHSCDDPRFKAFEACTQFLTPTLANPRLMDENLFRPLRYCYRTWKDGVVAYKHELIETARNWSQLSLPGSCPFTVPSLGQLAVHQKEYQSFLAAQELRANLSKLLNTASDGWVPIEDWESVQRFHKEIFEGMLQAVLSNDQPDDEEPIRSEEDLREIWPFDLPID